MIPSNVIFYVSSGTGNSLKLCHWALEFYTEKGIPAQIIPIKNAHPLEDLKDKENLLIFFVMPPHAFTAIWSMIKFAILFPRIKKARFVSLSSKGAFMFGSFLVPGISGSANYWISSILSLKGLVPEGICSINMPSNWTTVHSALSDSHIQIVLAKAKVRLQHFLNCLTDEHDRFFTMSNCADFLWGIILFPVTFFYFIYGKIALAKIFFTNNKCTSCGLCVNSCPKNALKMKTHGPFWEYHCEACMRCYNHCPHQAIEASYPWAFLLFIAASLITVTGVFGLLFYYLLVVGLYYVLYYLGSFSLPKALLSLTTPTRFYKRYKTFGDENGRRN